MPFFPVVLSLCDYTGNWARPYKENGYDVRQVDLKRGDDIRLLKFPRGVHGILAAPPCTKFCKPGARLWEEWGTEGLLEALSIVDACLRVIAVTRPKWWALENPPGRLTEYLGKPQYKFDPFDFGDPYTKRTYLWGKFNKPKRKPVKPTKGDITTKLTGAEKRSRTPMGFAKAFFEANP